MSLLHEVAVTPDVLLEAGYSVPELCAFWLGHLGPVFLDEAVVRDLREGAWSRQFFARSALCHPAGKELVEKLIAQNRLIPATCELPQEPDEPIEWGYEALASHRRVPLSAILMGIQVSETLGEDAVLCCAERVHKSSWWQSRGPSVRLHRQTSDYLEHLRLPLQFANSLQFVDPHLDPSRHNYREFHQLLEVARRQAVPPLIELHRVCYDGAGPNRQILARPDLESRFAVLDRRLTHANLKAEVLVWDDFHDRYLITNLIGISMPNGFDISGNPQDETTWTRLKPRDRDDVQREFDPASRRHELRYSFSLGN